MSEVDVASIDEHGTTGGAKLPSSICSVSLTHLNLTVRDASDEEDEGSCSIIEGNCEEEEEFHA